MFNALLISGFVLSSSMAFADAAEPRQGAAEPTRTAAHVITVFACVQRETDYRAQIGDGKGGVAGTGLGAGNEYVLRSLRTVSNATFEPTSPSRIDAGAVYSVTGDLEDELGPVVGKQVAVSGYVEVAETEGTLKVEDIPRLNAQGWHLVADQCDMKPAGGSAQRSR